MANQQPITNPSPRDRFQLSGENISKHRNLVDSNEFQRAIDFAMLEYASIVAMQVKEANSAAASGLRILGAHEFVHILRNLSEKTEIPKSVAPIKPLDYKV